MWLKNFISTELNNSKSIFSNLILDKKALRSFICISFIALFCCSGVFAEAGSIGVLDSAGKQILSLVSSIWVKALLVVALIIEFGVIAFGNAQGEGGVIKKVLPWIIGTAGVLGATSIVNFFFKNVTQEELSMATELIKSTQLFIG